jgi:hypothetical protein
METTNIQLTPQQREALSISPGQPIHISDSETRKVYLLLEQGTLPELEEDYVREGLEVARAEIGRGEVSTASIDEVIEKAQRAKN